MITNELLEEKYVTQQRLSEEAGYDIHRYVENMHKNVLRIQSEYGIKLKYRDIVGGKLDDGLT